MGCGGGSHPHQGDTVLKQWPFHLPHVSRREGGVTKNVEPVLICLPWHDASSLVHGSFPSIGLCPSPSTLLAVKPSRRRVCDTVTRVRARERYEQSRRTAGPWWLSRDGCGGDTRKCRRRCTSSARSGYRDISKRVIMTADRSQTARRYHVR
ncbi:Hypothetical protein RY70_1021 [Bifidobacterium bifidum]|nr:Hypothetical protein RY70_1021 [Bifidobacterium bifidum]